MTNQVIFKIDKKLKQRAMQKARSQGLPLAFILKLATQAFAEGRLNVDLVERGDLKPSTQRELRLALKDISLGKNISPKFKSSEEMARYLNQ